MLTKKDIAQIREIVEEVVERIVDKKISQLEARLTKRIEALELKVELYREQCKKEHEEIMNYLVESNKICSNQYKKLDKRVTVLENRGN